METCRDFADAAESQQIGEEAYECTEEDFQRVDESLRGQLPEGYYIQWLVTFNP